MTKDEYMPAWVSMRAESDACHRVRGFPDTRRDARCRACKLCKMTPEELEQRAEQREKNCGVYVSSQVEKGSMSGLDVLF